MGAVSTRGVWGRHSSSGKNFRDGRKVLGEEETIPSFVFFTLSSSEGALPWWKERQHSSTAWPWPPTPGMTRGYVSSMGTGVRGVEEETLQEKGLVHLHHG